MRRRIVFAIVVGSLIFGALNFPAISDVTADLLFVETDGNAIAPVNTVDAAPGDTLRVPVQTSNDEPLTVATIAVPGVGSIALLRTAAVPSLGPGGSVALVLALLGLGSIGSRRRRPDRGPAPPDGEIVMH